MPPCAIQKARLTQTIAILKRLIVKPGNKEGYWPLLAKVHVMAEEMVVEVEEVVEMGIATAHVLWTILPFVILMESLMATNALLE